MAFFIVSCSTNNEEIQIPEDERNSYLEIKEVSKLPEKLYKHTKRITSELKILSRFPNIEESVIVTYYQTPLRAIYTPLHHEDDSPDKMFYVYFELNGQVYTFDLLITEKNYSKNSIRYTYQSIDGNPIVQFDVEITNGQIINIERYPNKNWGDRFGNCIDWTFDNMNRLDYLGCMAVGPVCAGVIASMCAIAANEGLFIKPDNP